MNRALRPLLPMLLLLTGCFAHPTHPVTSTPPFQRRPGADACRVTTGDAVARTLQYVKQHAVWRRDHPGLVMLPHVERDIVRHFAGQTPLGPLRNVAAFGMHGKAPLTPRAMADLLLDGEAERFALAATTFRDVTAEAALPPTSEAAYRIEFLNRGAGPFKFDFRFTIRVERRELDGGATLLRYHAVPTEDGQGVTLYRGACLLEEDAEGCRVTEYLIVGTAFSVPFFLAKPARNASLRIFQDRASALWTRARWRAAGTDPLQASAPR